MPLTANGLPYPVRVGVPPDVQKDFEDLALALDPYVGETPGAWLMQTSAQTISNGVVTPLTFQVIDQLRGGVTIGSSGLVVPRVGWYVASAGIRWEGNTTGSRQIRLNLNGATLATDAAVPPSGGFSHTVSQPIFCSTVGDEIVAAGYQTSGGNLATSPSFGVYFSLVWVGP